MPFTGAFDPGRGCAGPSGLWATGCYLQGPSTPAEGVPALRAYGMWGEFGGRESDRHAKLRIGLPKRVGYRGLREQLVLEKKLVPCDSPEFYVFAENVAFSSPTAGAVIVNAGNVSGRKGSWRVEGTSKTYQDWHEEKLAKVGAAPADVE